MQRACLSTTATGANGNPWVWWVFLTIPLAAAAPVALCVYLRGSGGAWRWLHCLRSLWCCSGSDAEHKDTPPHADVPADGPVACAARVRRAFAFVAHLKPVVAGLQLCAALPAGLGFALPPLTTQVPHLHHLQTRHHLHHCSLTVVTCVPNHQILRAWSRLSLLNLRDLPVAPPAAAATAPAAPSAFYLALQVATLLPAAAFLLVVAAWAAEAWLGRRRAAQQALAATDGSAATDLLPPDHPPLHAAFAPSNGPLHRAAAAAPRGVAYAALLHLLVYLATAGVTAACAAALGPCIEADPDRTTTAGGNLVFGACVPDPHTGGIPSSLLL